MAKDLVACILWNDTETRLCAGQRRLDVEIFLDAIFVGKGAAHRFSGKNIAEDAGTHSNGGHSSAFRGWQCRPGSSSVQNGRANVYV